MSSILEHAVVSAMNFKDSSLVQKTEVSVNDHRVYMSAPSSPSTTSKGSMEKLCFYSAPTSPKYASDDHDQIQPTTPPKTDENEEEEEEEEEEDANSKFDDFEFETSRRFNRNDDDDDDEMEADNQSFVEAWSGPLIQQQQQQQQRKQQRQRGGSLPTIAFADDLFCDGKMVPLKPPPRLQHVIVSDNDKSSTCTTNSMPTSPKSLASVFKLPFKLQNLWNDDFDPFMVALMNVKEENRGRTQGGNHRRARSMSPLRACGPKMPDSPNYENHHPQHHHSPQVELETNRNIWTEPTSPTQLQWVPNQQKQQQMGPSEEASPVKLTAPKGVLYCRRARLVKVGQQKPRKTSTKPRWIEPTMGMGAGERGGNIGSGTVGEGYSTTRVSKKQRIKRFLLKSASMMKIIEKEKPEGQIEASPKPSWSKSFSFGFTQFNEDKKVPPEVTNMTITRYKKPKLSLCMGYASMKYVK